MYSRLSIPSEASACRIEEKKIKYFHLHFLHYTVPLIRDKAGHHLTFLTSIHPTFAYMLSVDCFLVETTRYLLTKTAQGLWFLSLLETSI